MQYNITYSMQYIYNVMPFCGQNHFHKQKSWKWVQNKYIASNSSCTFRSSTNLKNLCLKFSILMRITNRWLIKTDMSCVSIIHIAKQSNYYSLHKGNWPADKHLQKFIVLEAVAHCLKLHVMFKLTKEYKTSINSVWTANDPSMIMHILII